MRFSFLLLVCFSCFTQNALFAQDIEVEGYVFETDNRGVIKKASVIILDLDSNELMADTLSDKDGKFNISLPLNGKFRLVTNKNHYFQRMDTLSTFLSAPQEKIFVKIEMERKPGYVFDVTIAEAKIDENRNGVEGVQGARIEVFNNTTEKEELVLKDYPHPNFMFTFENGNHYTIMIRRKGYFNKRIEAYVNVEGCILCFDGLGIVEPGVTDVLSNGNAMGTFLANIDLQPLELNQTFKIENIYYDYNKSHIRPDAAEELNRLVGVLIDNPGVKVELGSHTDSRGSDSYNLLLSEKRAQSAVNYLVEHGGVDFNTLTAKGYGESIIVNQCKNGVKCDDETHEQNRRTELKIVGINEVDPLEKKSLKEILTEERLLKEVMNGEVIRVKMK